MIEHGPGFPNRHEWVAWGLRPCRGRECTVLINPTLREVSGFCVNCEERRSKRRRRRGGK